MDEFVTLDELAEEDDAECHDSKSKNGNVTGSLNENISLIRNSFSCYNYQNDFYSTPDKLHIAH